MREGSICMNCADYRLIYDQFEVCSRCTIITQKAHSLIQMSFLINAHHAHTLTGALPLWPAGGRRHATSHVPTGCRMHECQGNNHVTQATQCPSWSDSHQCLFAQSRGVRLTEDHFDLALQRTAVFSFWSCSSSTKLTAVSFCFWFSFCIYLSVPSFIYASIK